VTLKTSDGKMAVEAAQKISERYSELKSTLGFSEAAEQAQAEFLMNIAE
jgi:hypothetical protein